jgi:hypothetical protein
MNVPLRPDEVVLFEGDVTLLKSKLSVTETEVVISNQRMMVLNGKQAIEKADIASVQEGKHGFADKIVFTLRDGDTLAFTAANHAGFKAAALILAGQGDMSSLPTAPKLSKVKNTTAWLAAFGPFISGLITIVLGVMMSGDPESWSTFTAIKLLIIRMVLIYLFLRIDYLSLQKQGFNVKQLGIAAPITFPVYLFSRAKAFGHGKAYAIVWCVLVGIDILLML